MGCHGPMAGARLHFTRSHSVGQEDVVDMEEPNLIDGLDGFEEAEMAAFLQTLNQSGATP